MCVPEEREREQDETRAPNDWQLISENMGRLLTQFCQTIGGTCAPYCLASSPGQNPGDSLRTNIQLDFGDGTAVSYSNLSWTEEGIKHVYKSAGIFRVTALAENTLGYDTTTLYLHVTCPVEHVQLLAPFVVIRNKEVNISAVVLPSQPRTVTYFWWLGNNSEPVISLDGSISHTFSSEGMHSVTVQVSAGSTILQDTRTIAVKEFFKSLLLSFSPNLDEFNPDIPEWRHDVSRVIKKSLLQVSDFPEEQLLVAMFPGVPTAAELFLLPRKNQSETRKKTEDQLEKASDIIVSALNQNLVEFELKPGVRVIVYNTQLTLAPLVDSSPRHSSSAMLMLLSVVFLGLAVFLIYKFKRKIPWINIYAEVNQEKEQEMIGSVGQDSTPKITLSEFATSKELMEKELHDARVKRKSSARSHQKLNMFGGDFTSIPDKWCTADHNLIISSIINKRCWQRLREHKGDPKLHQCVNMEARTVRVQRQDDHHGRVHFVL
ncbi:hypothetical protein WMY93_006231 [Mugilogobius chulae]|uniref:PKD domain-containing protein n=1 Tax=Mugilogobius chulae TaxID=88201 RepID=A0AAW0PN97_9GOBI